MIFRHQNYPKNPSLRQIQVGSRLGPRRSGKLRLHMEGVPHLKKNRTNLRIKSIKSGFFFIFIFFIYFSFFSFLFFFLLSVFSFYTFFKTAVHRPHIGKDNNISRKIEHISNSFFFFPFFLFFFFSYFLSLFFPFFSFSYPFFVAETFFF